MKHHLSGLVLSAALALAIPAQPAAAAAPDGCSAAAGDVAAKPAPKKKKGFGLGSLLKAANEAGVGDMLGGGMLGRGRFGQVAGAVAGTAVSAAGSDGADSGTMGQFAGMAGSGRLGQVAGAVAGTAVNLARAAPRTGSEATAGAHGCAADPGAIVNFYK